MCVLNCLLQEEADTCDGHSEDVFIATEMGDLDDLEQDQEDNGASSMTFIRSSSTEYNPFPYEDSTEYGVGPKSSSSPPEQTSVPANESSPGPSTPQSQSPSPPLGDSSSPNSLRVRTSSVPSPTEEFSPFSELSPGSPNSLKSPGVLVGGGVLAGAESLDELLRALPPESSDGEGAENDSDVGSDGSWGDIIDGLSFHE